VEKVAGKILSGRKLIRSFGSLGGITEKMWQDRIGYRYLMMWIPCMLREIPLVGCSHLVIIDLPS
jgi:hypothetical protein